MSFSPWVVVAILVAAVLALLWLLIHTRKTRDLTTAELRGLKARFGKVVNADAEAARILGEAARREQSLRESAEAEAAQVRGEAARILADARQREQLSRDAAEAEAGRIVAEAVRREQLAQNAATTAEERREFAEMDGRVLSAQAEKLRAELAALEDRADLQSFGFYNPHYDFGSSDLYKAEQDRIYASQSAMIKAGSAAVCDTEWEVGGSKAEGRKMVNQTLRLMLRAFNGECDAAVARVKYNNVHVMEARIEKSYEVVNKAVSVQQCRITREYLALKLAELRIAHEYQEKLQEEKEEQRRIREQMREDEVARREIEKAQADAEKEETRFADALEKARAEVAAAVGARQDKLRAQVMDLERRLLEARERKARALSRAQLTRSGHVYVISNLGSFGENVYKIGMTRRLDPMDRIKELGDASVPFQFDVHAIIYTEDAPGLETKLHRLFTRRRLNRVNDRKEFFHATIDEIGDAVAANHGEIELTRLAEAVEFRKTLAVLNEEALDDVVGQSFPIPAHWQLRPPVPA